VGFYGYNVLSSISTVLFSEPKGGVWRFLYEILARQRASVDAHLGVVVRAATALLREFRVDTAGELARRGRSSATIVS
jgi:hypothetical protein